MRPWEQTLVCFSRIRRGMSLDFGVEKMAFLQSHLFPSDLIHLSAEFGMALEVSIYEILTGCISRMRCRTSAAAEDFLNEP